MGSPHSTVVTLLVLLLVIFAVSVLVRYVRLPYTIALLVTGLLGFQPGFRHIQLTPDLILTVFLPMLLFEGAYNVPIRSLWRNLLPVTLLAIPGVLVGSVITAVLMRSLLGLPWDVSFLFGALIASTDPIAVVSLFRDLGVPPRLALLVEGESLFNDGAAITLFHIVLIGMLSGSVNIGGGVLQFVVTVAGALAVGTVIGYGSSRLLRTLDNAPIQITVTVLAAYGSYLLAEYWTFSGAIAVVVAALFIGNYGSTTGLTPRSVYALGATWEFMGFVANSLVFLLIGIELVPFALVRNWQPILIAFVASLLGRAFAVYLLMPPVRGELRIPRPFRLVLLWGGLRGAVSLALVLSLPLTIANGQPFPERERLQGIAFGVVAVSLLLQGLTMSPLIRRLGLLRKQELSDERAAIHARRLAVEGALEGLAEGRSRGVIGGLQYERLTRAYQLERGQLEDEWRQLQTPLTESE